MLRRTACSRQPAASVMYRGVVERFHADTQKGVVRVIERLNVTSSFEVSSRMSVSADSARNSALSRREDRTASVFPSTTPFETAPASSHPNLQNVHLRPFSSKEVFLNDVRLLTTETKSSVDSLNPCYLATGCPVLVEVDAANVTRLFLPQALPKPHEHHYEQELFYQLPRCMFEQWQGCETAAGDTATKTKQRFSALRGAGAHDVDIAEAAVLEMTGLSAASPTRYGTREVDRSGGCVSGLHSFANDLTGGDALPA